MGKYMKEQQRIVNESDSQRKRKMFVVGFAVAAMAIVAGFKVAGAKAASPSRAEAVSSSQPAPALANPRSNPAPAPILGMSSNGMIVLPPIGLNKRDGSETVASSTWLAKMASEDGCLKKEIVAQLEKTRKAATVEDVDRLQGVCSSRRSEADPYRSQREALGMPVDKSARPVQSDKAASGAPVDNPWLPEPENKK
jgi:hypothetical protein